MNEVWGPLILCVDDERTGLLMRKLLLEAKGYRVVTAESGAEGIAILSTQAVDLVLLDYMLPGEDGGVIAEKMKKIKPLAPILMLSAYVDLPSERLACVDRYVIKGQAPTTLLNAVTDMLDGSSTASSQPPAA